MASNNSICRAFIVLLLCWLQSASDAKIRCAGGKCTCGVKAGNWIYYAHGTRAGEATLINDKQIEIKGFNYDGKGPEAWFSIGLGKNSEKIAPCGRYRSNPLIGNIYNDCGDKPGKIDNANIIITIPPQYSWKQIDYVGLYCYKFQHLFGYVKIPPYKESLLGKYNGESDKLCTKEWEKWNGKSASICSGTFDNPAAGNP